ncbi:MAG: D-aminoacylase [Candidatus Moranbacteria bacterium]|jgi:N-acyl-D-amino-acid deacylase|nr:D-aminoacylase [Candidatus Moranbacteria bacterium]MDX9855610.1 D-aminoacylase [Candidatus Moranbacteria bacterium]
MFDIIIKNGIIIDGTGAPMLDADLGIKDGEIAEIGDLENEKGEREIDARGKYVAPGFIDVNNHSDTRWRIFSNPSLKSLVYQGITTIVGGTCGSSLAPLNNEEMIKAIRKWMDVSKLNINWVSTEEFLKEIERSGMAVNFATLVGHGTVRRGIAGDSTRDLHEIEMKVMQDIIEEALKEGAVGLSSGLVYSHAKLANPKELVALNKIVAKKKKIYATHIRNEAGSILDSLDEAIKTAKESEVRLHISHLKVVGRKNWPLMDRALKKIEDAKLNGVEISFDVYPYTATGSVLYTFLPDWVSRGGRRMMLDRLRDPEKRKNLIEEMKKSYVDYSKIIVASHSLGKSLTRKVVGKIAEAQGKGVEETVINLLLSSDGRIITITEALGKANLDKAVLHPLSIIASNGSGYDISHKNSGDLVHPRDFGTFPRVLAYYVREKKMLSWEDAINKMTGKPAEIFRLEKRGAIKEKNFADVVIFDPAEIGDRATIDKPYQYSVGIDYVLVNGEIILDQGKYTSKKAGLVLRK